MPDLPGFQNLEGLAPSLVIRVTDTGAGILPEALPFVFDRFFQADNQEYASASGSGIGLSLTKELVKAMDGDISVSSRVGEGTTFTVRLPISNKAEKDTVQTENSDSHNFESLVHLPEKGTQRPETHHRLLLIEDNPDVMEYLAACLRDTYTLDFAYNGRAGIEKALETAPDLIISDVQMPTTDGIEFIQWLRREGGETNRYIPVILVTGHTKDGEPELNWQALCQPGQTLVFYMGHKALGRLCARLIEHGLPAALPAALIENGTLPEQRQVTATLDTLAAAVARLELRGPALVVIGEVAAFAEGGPDGRPPGPQPLQRADNAG